MSSSCQTFSSDDFSITRQRVIKRLRTTKPIRPTLFLQALEPIQPAMEFAIKHRLVPDYFPQGFFIGKKVLFEARYGLFARQLLKLLHTFRSFMCPRG